MISVKLTIEPLGCPVNIESTSSMTMLASVNAFLLLNLGFPQRAQSRICGFESSIPEYRQLRTSGAARLDNFDPIPKAQNVGERLRLWLR